MSGWDDVEAFICEKLYISQNKFRDYHEVVGGDYKDWWHVWITLVFENVRNDSYDTIYKDVLDFDSAQEEYGDWIMVLKPIIDQLFTEYGDDGKMTIYYSW